MQPGRQFFEAKSEDFFRAASDIGFCVFPRLDSPRGVSGKTADNERTFWCPQWHRFADNIKPREPNSLSSAIENRADDNSDSGFARLCFVQWCHEGAHTKVLKLSADYEHTLWNVPNLEKHRSSGMSDAEWLEIPDFAIKIAASGCIWNAIVSFSCHKTYPVKMQSVTVPFPENKKESVNAFFFGLGCYY